MGIPARKRVLKGLVQGILHTESSIKRYNKDNNTFMVTHYKKQCKDLKYLKRLLLKDMLLFKNSDKKRKVVGEINITTVAPPTCKDCGNIANTECVSRKSDDPICDKFAVIMEFTVEAEKKIHTTLNEYKFDGNWCENNCASFKECVAPGIKCKDFVCKG